MIEAGHKLSYDEWQLAMLLGLGHKNKEIAVFAVQALRTIENRRARTYRKLGVVSRAGVTAWALENGIGQGYDPFALHHQIH